MMTQLIVFYGRSYQEQFLPFKGYSVGKREIKDFGNGEIITTLKESIRMKDVLFVQLFNNHDYTTRLENGYKENHSVNDLLMETFLFGDCAQRIAARLVSAYIDDFIYDKTLMKRLFAASEFDFVYVGDNKYDLTQLNWRRGPILIEPDLDLVVVKGSSGKSFGNKIIDKLEEDKKVISLEDLMEFDKSNGKIFFTKQNLDLCNKDVYFVQCLYDPTHPRKSVNDNILESLLFAYYANNQGAARVTGVFPYFAYSRQDKRFGRQPISVSLFADLLYASGYDVVVTIAIHSEESEGSFPKRLKFEDLPAEGFMIKILKEEYGNNLSEWCILSPDIGKIKLARGVATGVNARFSVANKRRIVAEKVEETFILDKIVNYNLVFVDDIIGTGGTIEEAVKAAKRKKPKEIVAAICIHPIFNSGAEKLLSELHNNHGIVIYGSDSIPHSEEYLAINKWFNQVSITSQFAEVIYRLNQGLSLSELYTKWRIGE